MQMNVIVYNIAIWALPLLLAITLHEAAHGWVAWKLGDPTAKALGRISANPIKHIDPMGTVVLPLILVSISGFVIGWAKPVPVDMRYFRQPHLDMALVALAGPISNFLMALGWALLILLTGAISDPTWLRLAPHLFEMGKVGVTINLVLMVLNLLPIPPLDGGRVVAGVLPAQFARAFSKIEPFGMLIVIVLLVSGILGKILWPLVLKFKLLIAAIVGI